MSTDPNLDPPEDPPTDPPEDPPTDPPEDPPEDPPTDPPEDSDTFPREYVERLRTESAAHRTRAAGMADELHTLRVKSLGLLQDPTDLPYSDGLDTTESVRAAAEELVSRKPHLKARRVRGDIGQHEKQDGAPSPGLLGRMKKNA